MPNNIIRGVPATQNYFSGTKGPETKLVPYVLIRDSIATGEKYPYWLSKFRSQCVINSYID